MDFLWHRRHFTSTISNFVVLLGVAVCTRSIAWTSDHIQIVEGGEMTVSCEAKGVGYFEVLRVTKINGNMSKNIADNSDIKYPFFTLARYQITFHSIGEDSTLNIHYKDIQPEDAGLLYCFTLGSNDNKSSGSRLNLTVIPSVKEISFFQTVEGQEQPIANGSEILLKQDMRSTITCSTSTLGFSPAPAAVTMTLEGHDVRRSISSYATEESSENTTLLGAVPFRTFVNYNIDRPDADVNGKTLMCTAGQPGQAGYIKVVARLVVHYAPVIACDPINEQTQTVLISCLVHGNPASTLMWFYDDRGTRLEINSFDTKYKIKTTQISNNNTLKTEITVPSMINNHRKDYLLKAVNQMGSTEEIISFRDSHDTNTGHRHWIGITQFTIINLYFSVEILCNSEHVY